MYTTIEQFEKDWRHNAEGTLRVIRAMTTDALNQAPTEGFRTLGKTAWHLVTTIPEMMNQTGLEVKTVSKEHKMPATAEGIAKQYEAASEELLSQVKSKWTDQSLGQEDEMYGQTWKKGMTVHALLMHDVHHRGQMTTLLRMAGLKVPGVFGPAKEEWSAYGMEAPE